MIRQSTMIGALALCALAMPGLALDRANAQSADNIALYKGPDRAQRLLEGARKEGQITVYSSMIVDQALRPLIDGFVQKYPFIKPQYVREDPPQQIQKLTAEARANRRVADVVESTGIEVQMRAAGLNQPYWSPEAEPYGEARKDKDGMWVSTRVSYIGACYNPNLVKPEEAPKNFEDLLDPKWKGKLVWSANWFGSILFITGVRKFMGEEKAADYLRKLAQQNVISVPATNRVVVDRVMAGEYPICLDAFLHHPIISARKGAPVVSLPFNPVITLVSSVALPKNPPHPHAAMLFIDYLLSPEGQSKLKGADYFPAHPAVSASDDLAKIVPAKIGLKENFLTPEDLVEYLKVSRELYERLFVK